MAEVLHITEAEKNLRLDVFLTEKFPDISRSHMQKLIATRAVTINGRPATSNYKTRIGDSVEVRVPAAQPLSAAVAEAIPLDIIYEDRDLIVVNKPKGMVVHPAPGAESGTLVNALLAHCPDLPGIGGIQRPGIVHRLDRDTSGLLVVAKSERAHRSLSMQIRERIATRKYQALLWGRAPFRHAVIDAPIMRDPQHRKRMTVFEDVETTLRYPRRETDTRLPHRAAQPGAEPDELDLEQAFQRGSVGPGKISEWAAGGGRARSAVTELRLIEHLGLFSWVEAILQTGRTHQIRVHCAFSGHPVVGDKVYGGVRRVSANDLRGPWLHALNDRILALHGQALHAYELSFDHPADGRRMEFTAPLPAEITHLVDYLRRLDDESNRPD